jgi:hypothetical protein
MPQAVETDRPDFSYRRFGKTAALSDLSFIHISAASTTLSLDSKMSLDASRKATSAYWDRRMKRDSVQPGLAELVEELNRQLRADPGYRPDARFTVARSGSGAEFPTWEGPPAARSLIHRVLQAYTRDVALPVPFQMD